MKPLPTIHVRLLLPFIGLLVAGIGAAWWIAASALTKSLESRLDDQLIHTAGVLSEEGIPLTKELLTRMSRLLKADIVLIGSDGKIARSTVAASREALRRYLQGHWESALAGAGALQIEAGSEPYKLVARTLSPHRDARYRALLLVASLGDLRDAARRAAWWLGAAALAGALVMAWIGHRITLSITAPIQALSRGAQRVADGERSIHIETGANGELGTLTGAFNTMVDSLQRYEERLAEQGRLAALGEMAGRVAHEIRNPLTAIKMQLQLMAESADGGVASSAAGLVDEVRRLELIVNGVLRQGRPLDLETGPADLNRIALDIGELFRPHLGHQGIVLDTDLDEGLAALVLDSDRVKQILVNLLVNARDALPGGGRILIGTGFGPERQSAILSVSDSGPGISPGRRPGLLGGRFSSRKSAGLGLGLRVVKEIADAHRGQVDIDTGPLGGARVLIHFPLPPTA